MSFLWLRTVPVLGQRLRRPFMVGLPEAGHGGCPPAVSTELDAVLVTFVAKGGIRCLGRAAAPHSANLSHTALHTFLSFQVKRVMPPRPGARSLCLLSGHQPITQVGCSMALAVGRGPDTSPSLLGRSERCKSASAAFPILFCAAAWGPVQRGKHLPASARSALHSSHTRGLPLDPAGERRFLPAPGCGEVLGGGAFSDGVPGAGVWVRGWSVSSQQGPGALHPRLLSCRAVA